MQEEYPVETEIKSKPVSITEPNLEMENKELKRQLNTLKKQIIEKQCMEKVLLLDSIELDQKSVKSKVNPNELSISFVKDMVMIHAST